ncbi:hypothetical protein DIURU_003146 [Diutina rugosa]|uniref:mRNA-capping enzyme subunit beta n=1 Tax=Diutina rugosa TaxID=5481 RepID=A0A642UMD4_DIURU|nr:uncharacterized protein DIURU_003146 [Diutina rugosa]KAA8901618.1 hypothetical protein DIURU_003146 [Diutina rugosa]
MNLGGILNNDSPPADEASRPHQERSASEASTASVHQRNSITNILNGDDGDAPAAAAAAAAAPPAPASTETTASKEPATAPTNTTAPATNSAPSASSSAPGASASGDPIDSGLAKIAQLKGKTRPRRYSTPPVWAQEWVPHVRDEAPVSSGPQLGSILSDKRVFDYNRTQSVDLECSISGVIPAQSVVRTIAEWIFANFRDISPQNRPFVELEVKFGTITDKRTSNRISIDVATDCVYTNHSEVYFEMEVAEPAFKEVQRYLGELESKYQESGRGDRNRPRRKFSHLETDITDSFYQVERPKEPTKSIRVSKDNSLSPARYSAIEKQRISDLFVHCPSSMYDLRLSLALEFPVPEQNIEAIISKGTPVLQREKKRSSWTHAPTVSRIDLTRVSIPKDSRGQSGRKVVEYTSNYEIEQEIDTNEVFLAMDKFKAGEDAFRFEELVEIFLNNARVLNSVVTKIAR